MRERADGRRRAADGRADPKGGGILQAITHERHARADSEKVAGTEAEDRPAGDDLLDGKDAIAKREFLFYLAVDR